ncbi:hypothetical protein U1Q18_037357, partial [Sarracenia purpurea var. burkii]
MRNERGRREEGRRETNHCTGTPAGALQVQFVSQRRKADCREHLPNISSSSPKAW